MLPESRILRNKFHNDSVVKLIMEQPSLDDPTAVIDQAVKQQYADMGDEYGIKGLTGNVPQFIPKEIKSWYEKKYKRKFPPGMTTYASWPEYVADVLYRSKGTIDNENNATRALLSIKSAKQFTEVQKELQKKTGGQGIGQFVAQFFGTYTTDKAGKVSGYVGKHVDAAKRLERIVAHLKRIGANAVSTKYFDKALQNVKQVNVSQNKKWTSDEMAPFRAAYTYRHEIALVASLVVPFFSPFGLALSSGIMLGDAAMYAKEGDYLSAGYSAIFALLPGIGGIVGKIPAIGRLEAKGMAALGKKLATSNIGALNRLELSIIKDMSKYQNLIKQDLNEYFQRRFQNEMIDAIKKTKSPILRKILYRLGNGSMKASVLGGKLLKFGVRTLAPYEISMRVWDNVYNKSFLQAKQQELEAQREIEQILKKYK